MDTSRSSESSLAWEATASLFSGRPDPRWRMDPAAVEHLKNLWAELPPSASGPLKPPALGYRGSSASGPGHERFFAFGGVVRREAPDGTESRRDDARAFERAILASAPAGLIPTQFLDIDSKTGSS